MRRQIHPAIGDVGKDLIDVVAAIAEKLPEVDVAARRSEQKEHARRPAGSAKWYVHDAAPAKAAIAMMPRALVVPEPREDCRESLMRLRARRVQLERGLEGRARSLEIVDVEQ